MARLQPLFSRILIALLLAFVVGTGASPAFAAGNTGALTGLALPTCIARDGNGMTPRERFAAKFDCSRAQTAFGPGDYWVRAELTDSIRNSGRRSRVRIASLWQDSVTLYARYADGGIYRQKLGGNGANRHLQLGAMIEWILPDSRRSEAPVALLWHVEGSANLRGVILAPTLARRVESEQANLEMGAIYAAFGGLCLALLVYNLAMWGALRYRFQLAYCCMVATLLLYAFTSSGAMAWAWPDMLNNDRMRLNYVLLGMAAISAVQFALTFFEREIATGHVRRIAQVMSSLLLLATVSFVALAPWQAKFLESCYTLSFLAILGVLVPIIMRAWRHRSPHIWLFIAAWTAPIIFAALRLATNMHVIPWNFWIDNSTILSMSCEAIISSLAIAYRIRLLSRERDNARANEIAARMLADHDPLTALLNRRAFLAQAIGRSGEQTLLIIDIDHFKRVNDTLGHDGGDEVLRVFARALRQAAPPGALVARIGGEEFALICDASIGLQGEAVLARLRAERMPFDLNVTASIGVCSAPLTSEHDWKALYRSADRALFAAKAAGRDRVRSADQVAAAA